MTFHQLPARLRVYMLAHVLLLIPVAALLFRQQPPGDPVVAAVLLGSALMFSIWNVEVGSFQARVTLASTIVCLALLMQGPQAALACAVSGALAGSYLRPVQGSWKLEPRRPSHYKAWFNVVNCALACGTASLAFNLVAGGVEHRATGWVLGLLAFAAAEFLVNTVGVALAIACQKEMPWKAVWKENFLWTAPGFFASVSIAAGIRIASQWMGALSLLFLPPLYFIYYSYRLYLDRVTLLSERVQGDAKHIEQLRSLNQAIITSLATAIDAKDQYTCSHIHRVQKLAIGLARAAGLEGPELEAVATGALVHDVGKLGIPDHILGKPGKLTAEEFKRIQSHVAIGAEILAPVPFEFPVIDVVRTHHERWDGLGYPAGLKGEEIPLGGRIIALVDVYDALTSDRPYRRAMHSEAALEVLRQGSGKQFDPRLVELFEVVLPEVTAEIDALEATGNACDLEETDAPAAATALQRISGAAAEMAAIWDVGQALTELETLEQVAAAVVTRTRALLPVDTAVLYLLSPDGGMEAVAVDGAYGDKLHRMTIQRGEGVVGWVAAHLEPRVNESAAPDVARRFSPGEQNELNAVSAVPLTQGAECLGVLAVYTQAYRLVTEHHLQVLSILAEHAATAVQSTRRLERTNELAFTDPLTGLANSRCLYRQLDRFTHCGAGSPPFSILMLDLDRFKTVNDVLGHLRGDDLLRQVAAALTGVVRPGDLVCRYAGDEFVVVLAGAGKEQAEQLASRVRRAVGMIPPAIPGLPVGSSVGAASFPDDGTDARTLLHAADERMYADKEARKQAEEGEGDYELPGLEKAEPRRRSSLATTTGAPALAGARG
jgi:diguanylate cyclase (GGDEF)-like protein/putative nucleotidyltransferase with HDIG domain